MGHQEAHCASLDLVLTGCVRRALGPHRVGDSLVRCLSGSLARLLRLRKGGDLLYDLGGEMSESKKLPFRASRKCVFGSNMSVKYLKMVSG